MFDKDLEVVPAKAATSPCQLDLFGTVRGATIRVSSGGYFDFNNPQHDQFTFTDIALGLAREGRYVNQTLYHYTVAMHLLNCLHVARQDGMDIETQRAVLMHDASEGLMKDVPKPLKMLLPDYTKIEHQVQRMICDKYGVKCDDPSINIYVKQIDREMLIAEKNELFTYDGVAWHDEGRVRKQWPCLFLDLEDITELSYKLKVAANELGINTEI